jgi:hypothetical protein
MLSDLFLHGIGGGKYDELTDGLIRQVFGLQPPAFVVLSATRWLPIPAALLPQQPTTHSIEHLLRLARGLTWAPERYLSIEQRATLKDIVQRKSELIDWRPHSRKERRQRFRLLRQVNERLRPAVGHRQALVRRDLVAAQQQCSAQAVLQRRDYSFCLYPELALRPFFSGLL